MGGGAILAIILVASTILPTLSPAVTISATSTGDGFPLKCLILKRMFGLTSSRSTIDLDRLLRLRVAIARIGEMDNAAWWNTRGLLSTTGASVFRRGFPRTRVFAQARAAIGVAAVRCQEVYSVPGAVTLWNLGATVEDQFEERWQTWLDDVPSWQPFFAQVAGVRGADVSAALRELNLVDEQDTRVVQHLRSVGEGRGVALPPAVAVTDASITLLTLGFGRGEPSKVAVPYLPISLEGR